MNILTPKTVSFDGSSHEASAVAVGTSIGHLLDTDIAVLAKAKADYEGGPFRVMFKLLSNMKPEDIAALPDHKSDGGNNPRFYKTKKMNTDGKEKMTDRDYYKVIADSLPEVVAAQARINMLNMSMKDPTKFNLSSVPQDIKDMKEARRYAEIGRLGIVLSTARKNVPSALELYSQIRRFQDVKGVDLTLLYKIDHDSGKELDGEEGRERVIDDTKSPIILTTKLERRRDVDKARVGVTGLMRFDTDKAIEQGGSWDALLATVKKGTKEKDKDGASNPKSIRTPDTAAQAMTDYADYLTFIQDDPTKASWEAYEKSLKGAGSDDAFMNACIIFNTLQLLVGNPKDQARFQKLWNDSQAAAA